MTVPSTCIGDDRAAKSGVSAEAAAVFSFTPPQFSMSLIPVSASSLVAVGHNPLAATLGIEFRGGRLYLYARVPWSEYQGLVGATSPGTYFRVHIYNRYSYRRIR